MRDNFIQDDLVCIYSMEDLAQTIKSLEERGLTIHRQKELIDNIHNKLPLQYKAKLEQTLSKNPSYEQIFGLDSQEAKTNYFRAPSTSCDVAQFLTAQKYIDRSSKTIYRRRF